MKTFKYGDVVALTDERGEEAFFHLGDQGTVLGYSMKDKSRTTIRDRTLLLMTSTRAKGSKVIIGIKSKYLTVIQDT